MATIQRFEDLKVWQQARAVAKHIYVLTKTTSLSSDYELRNQISRSSGSVMDNIAEGFGRGSRTEFIQFLGYSLGSNDEMKSQLYRSLDRNHLDQHQFDELYQQVDVVTKMIVAFIHYLKRTEHRGLKYNTTVGVEEPNLVNYEPQTTNHEQ
ncbi:four helix bundle protein [Spirosoma oryzae]|uniref:Four helix bundle protein n=1 Tax=Spirosoma oryzae TaxID=1469603 RepID=A0A2T0SPZ9_9BACT|nr:four helix bundle protein [Spirosoma oryzae]PRY35485.1 four helix bundle protein [Spirosoma oryzae]